MNARRLTLTALVSLCTVACGLAFSIAVASGEMVHRYETQISGPSVGEPFGDPWGVAFDGSGRLLVGDAPNSALDVFEPSGVFAPPQLVNSALSGTSATRSIAVAAGTGDLYVGSSGPESFAGGGSESVYVFKPEGGNKYRLLDERRFAGQYGNFPYIAVDNSTNPLDERKGDVYVLALSPTNGSLGEVFVIKPNAAGELPEETIAEEQGKALPQPSSHVFSIDFSSQPTGSGGIAVDSATGDVYVSNPDAGVVDVFNDKGEEQPALNLDGSETPGRFGPDGITIDSADETVYVVSKEEHAVDEFSKAGKFLGQIKQTPFEEELVEPKGVAVQEAAGPARGDVYVSNGHSIDIFGPGLVLPDVALAGASSVGKSEATLNGTVDPNEIPVSECEFEYMSSDESAFTHSASCSPSPGSGGAAVAVSAAISGLTADTTYLFRLSATNANGTGDGLGREASFKTPPAVEGVSTGAASTGAKPTDEKLTGSLSPDGTDAHYYFQYGTSTVYGSTSPAPPGVDAGTGGAGCVPLGGPPCSPVSAETSLHGLESDTLYHYRMVAVDSFGTTYGEDATFTTGGPGLQEAAAFDVASSSATLAARIVPRDFPTTYYFQYGTSAEYGSAVPAPPGTELNPAEASIAVTQHLDGLQADTIYHYRVVAISELAQGVSETFAGPDRTFTTQTAGGGLGLPDGRAWEMVSPPNKEGADLAPISEQYGLIVAAADGDAITYVANRPTEAAPQGYDDTVQVLSTHSPQGWESRDITASHIEASGQPIGYGPEYRFFSSDLSRAAVQPYTFDPALSAEASERTAYLGTNYLGGDVSDPCSASCFRPLVTGAPGYANVPPGTVIDPREGPPQFVGATPDMSHIVLSSGASLTPGSNGGLYEWDEGKLTFIGAGTVGNGGDPAKYAISNDGGRIVFVGLSEFREEELFMRDVTKGQTVKLDAVQGGKSKASFNPRFQAASSDGSKVFFTDGAKLTKDAGASGEARDLYECEIVEVGGELQCKLSDLTPVGAAHEQASVQGGILGASEDGSWLYFVAKGALGTEAVTGEDNLYVLHYDGARWESPKFIAALSEGDVHDWYEYLSGKPARVSPNGDWLAFMSQKSLTGYDNHDVVTGAPDAEIYLYHASTGRLMCASCDPTGGRPVGVKDKQLTSGEGGLAGGSGAWEPDALVAADVTGWQQTSIGGSPERYQSRYLTDSGRLFFNSDDALVPQDVNGTDDVYQYEPPGVGSCTSANTTYSESSGGCVELISSGSSSEESAFLDAGESGADVFFLTSERLAPQDFDTSIDVYDAHECTEQAPCAAAPAIPPPCSTGDACKPAPTPQPSIFGSPSSATFSGAGNVAASTPASVKPRSLTKAQKLMRALKACGRQRSRGRRAACERKARRRYAASKPRKANTTERGKR